MTIEITTGMFGRINENGNVMVLHIKDGAAVSRIAANIYPIGSNLSARHEHPAGIVISRADAELINLEIE